MMTARLWSYLAGLLLIAGVLAGLYAWGRADGREAQRKDDAAMIERKNAALRKAGAALSAAAVRFREIDAATVAEVARSARDMKDGKAAGKAAANDRAELQRRIESINAARDESPCRDQRTGVPLQ